jgi:hypothetical protein
MDLKRLAELRKRIAKTPTAGIFGDEALELIAALDVAEQRLRLARWALVRTGYFRESEVGDDVAPRITELDSARTARADAAEPQVAALTHALRLYHEMHEDECSCDGCWAYEALQDEVEPAAAQHDARVAREAVAAFIASERASQKLSEDPDHDRR